MSKRPTGLAILLAVGVIFAGAVASTADAARQTRKRAPRPAPTPKDAALIVDGTSGRVLYERNADAVRHPASLTKMMSLYLLFEALEKGTMTLQTEMPVSTWASGQSPTKLNVKAGESVDVDTAIRAIVILSANDVAVVIGEALGGTESAFANMMDAKARDLGMWRTNYENASGLPDIRQVTTASDMARLGRRIAYDFPRYYSYFSLNEFSYRGRRYETHNNLLGVFAGADGIKTGYTRMSGFNLVTSAVRNNKHIVGVVMGGGTAVGRDQEMMRLLGIAFGEAEKNPLLVAQSNVPWLNGPGDKTSPDWDTPALAKVELAAFHPNNMLPTQVATLAGATRPAPGHPPGRRPVVTASIAAIPTPKPERGIAEVAGVPRPKPEVTVATDAAANADKAPATGPDSEKVWTIQIGAFGDRESAYAQLAKVAERSSDVLSQAKQLVDPRSNGAGKTVFRARFGLFARDEALAVCKRVATRGATCFATLLKS